jgi:serine/threonine protein phosphatase PrpC
VITVCWGAALRPKHGQTICGDAFVVQPLAGDALLVAVVDGLGGGAEAAHAAQGALASISSAPERTLPDLLSRAHNAIHGTRGAVIGLLRLDLARARLAYIGVGNIGVHAYSQRPIKPISKNGILGYRMPTLLELSYTFDPGDCFVLFSDGISSRFTLDRTLGGGAPAQELADTVLERYGKTTDDATVVVIGTTGTRE